MNLQLVKLPTDLGIVYPSALQVRPRIVVYHAIVPPQAEVNGALVLRSAARWQPESVWWGDERHDVTGRDSLLLDDPPAAGPCEYVDPYGVRQRREVSRPIRQLLVVYVRRWLL